MSDRVDRRAELERKKARLAQIRAEKQNKASRKEEEKKVAVTVSSELDRKRKETEDLLRTVGIDYPTVTTSPESPKKSLGGVEKDEPAEPTSYRTRTPKASQLGQSKITITSVAPRELVTYAKETQTPKEEALESEDEIENLKDKQSEKEQLEIRDKMEEDEEEEEEEVVRELSEAEKSLIEASEDYQSFMARSARFMERALAHRIDLFSEYNTQIEDDSELERGLKLAVNRVFSDERWSRHRVVTSLDWSVHHPELCVASYSSNEEAPYEPEGVALVWNSKYKTTTPEYIFQCQSAITSSCFAKFHPNLVVGGTYSGQIVLWDNRANKRTAQRSKLSTAAHTHPVYCMDMVGTQNAHNLISVSTDGKMCSWSLDMLSQPLETMELQHKQSKSVAVTTMSFQLNNVNNFAVGAEDGSVYTACRHGNKTGISDVFEGHTGPVTGLAFHRAPGQLDFSHLLLTSSLDWTIKLWSVKGSSKECLHSFKDRSDCVYDVAWSPSHPSLFASGDCAGRVELWNFNADTEVPVVSSSLDSSPAISKLKWNSSGSQIALGDHLGRVHLCDIGEQLGTPRTDEWSRMMRSLNEIQSIHREEEEAKMVSRHL